MELNELRKDLEHVWVELLQGVNNTLIMPAVTVYMCYNC